MTTMMQCYSMRGISAVAALNISSTVSNLFNIVFMSIGSSIGIIVGNLLGANKLEEAKDTDKKIIALSVCTCLFFGAALAVAAPFIPRLYNTGDEVKTLATRFLWVSACMMPFNAFTHACYFTLRSGGQTRITMLFDSCFVWALCIPVAFVLSRFTALPILPLYIVCCSHRRRRAAAGLTDSGKSPAIRRFVSEKRSRGFRNGASRRHRRAFERRKPAGKHFRLNNCSCFFTLLSVYQKRRLQKSHH